MINRRTFLSRSMLGTAGLTLGLWSCGEDGPAQAEKTPAPPLVLATWTNREAVAAAAGIIDSKGTALDAVEAGVRVAEANPEDMSVGYGGRPDRDGRVTLDACIMDHAGNAGSVACVEDIMHPVSVARKVMEKTPHVMLVGEGAARFALENGFERTDLLTPEARRQWEVWRKTEEYRPEVNIERHDTIGMLALDAEGRLAGACTTSGMAYKMHGRVGDSPIIGAGLFVDGEVGGACATGLGEYVMKTLGSFLIVELMRQGWSPGDACRETVRRLVDKYPLDPAGPYQVGFIALNAAGEWGGCSVAPGFSCTLQREKQLQTLEAPYLV